MEVSLFKATPVKQDDGSFIVFADFVVKVDSFLFQIKGCQVTLREKGMHIALPVLPTHNRIKYSPFCFLNAEDRYEFVGKAFKAIGKNFPVSKWQSGMWKAEEPPLTPPKIESKVLDKIRQAKTNLIKKQPALAVK